MSNAWTYFARAAASTLLACASLAAVAADNNSPDNFASAGTRYPGCAAASAQVSKISEQGYLRVGGVEQWLTIQGSSCANPVVLFLHGGPGNPLSPYADAIYGAWQKDFTLVQWDQRGAGMSYGRNPPSPDAAMTLDQMVADGLEVAQFLTRHLGQRKIILMGSSWGSVLGVHMAKRRPELFMAYVGTAQLVSQVRNQAAFFDKLKSLAQAAGDQKTLAALDAVGPPPWQNPRAFGVVRRAGRAYEGKVSTPAPKHWWQPAALYATPQALEHTEQGEDYSWLQFVGFKNNGIFLHVDLPKLGTDFAVPVYLVQGEQDLLTPVDVTRPFFDSITAPDKALVLVPLAGHDPNEAMVAAQYQLLKERVVLRK
ncbi:alpha/beta fold hydrolase [Rhodoferax sp. AJA081-3]|uniref:alpha/beta fold hydrolase n=1 Tax=Rhodoferax sp. AJA081-3 TaxID=2752316 RepID=UPI001AE01C3A|nr:alpha/beta hydrolase [Rhodoferax sp. AJA081-3]